MKSTFFFYSSTLFCYTISTSRTKVLTRLQFYNFFSVAYYGDYCWYRLVPNRIIRSFVNKYDSCVRNFWFCISSLEEIHSILTGNYYYLLNRFGPSIASAIETSVVAYSEPYFSYKMFTGVTFLIGAFILIFLKLKMTKSLFSKI